MIPDNSKQLGDTTKSPPKTHKKTSKEINSLLVNLILKTSDALAGHQFK